MRKTIEVSRIREQINKRIRASTSEETHKELCLLLESILHATGNYEGFQYIAWAEGGYSRWRESQPMREYQEDRMREFPKGLGMPEVPREFLGPEYWREYY